MTCDLCGKVYVLPPNVEARTLTLYPAACDDCEPEAQMIRLHNARIGQPVKKGGKR